LTLPLIEKPVILNIESNSELSVKIKKIILKNFKGFVDKEFSFSDQFNLLLGDNGSGKTAVLDALALLLSSIFIGFDETEKRSPIKDEDVRQVSNPYGDEARMEPNYPVSIEAQGIVMEYPVHWNKRRLGSQNQTDDVDWDLTAITAGFNPHVRQGKHVTLPVIAYYGTGRLWLRTENEKVEPIPPVSRLHAYKDCLDPRSNEKELVRWMKEQELFNIQKNIESNLYDAVKKAIINCIEECKEIWYDVRRDSIMLKRNDGHCLPAYLFSDGYRNMIAMAADIAYRMAMLNPHLGTEVTQTTPGVVLIDEIDLHLHPNWQRRVVNDLKRAFPCVQFIATSHSPFIVQSLKGPEELINLNDEMEPFDDIDKSIEDIAEDIMDVPIPQKSKRYSDMIKIAEQYYDLLEEGKSAETDEELKKIKSKLDELSIPFSDDPAFQAFLKMERTAAGLNETDRKRNK
jgi:predicted ATP-binding protein involved in virulence